MRERKVSTVTGSFCLGQLSLAPADAALGEGEDEQVWRKRMRPILDTVAFKMCPL